MYNKHHGEGILKLSTGSIYKGNFFEGKFDGKGKFIWSNGEEYEGEWSDD